MTFSEDKRSKCEEAERHDSGWGLPQRGVAAAGEGN